MNASIINAESMQQVALLGNQLKQRHFLIIPSPNHSYRVSYIGDVLQFVARACNQLDAQGWPLSDVGKQWIRNQLPIPQTVSVEIGPRLLLNYLHLIETSDPLGQLKVRDDVLAVIQYFSDL